MSQTIIKNIDSYTIEIVNGSLIVTPKNKITGDMFKVGKTLITKDAEFIIQKIENSFVKDSRFVITCANKNNGSIRMFNINTYDYFIIDHNDNIIFNIPQLINNF